VSIPAGWYDDGSGAQRWWDGQGWTERLADAPPSEATSASVAPGQPVPSQAPAYVPPQGAPYASQPGATNGLAIAALVLGILGFGVIPVIFGHIALGQIKRQPQQQGRGMAIAGLVLGYIAVGFWVLVVGILALGGLFAAVGSASYR